MRGWSYEQINEILCRRQTLGHAVNYPLTYFAERIGGDFVDVLLPVPAGTDPAGDRERYRVSLAERGLL